MQPEIKICPRCGKEHNRPRKFCSRSCANSRTYTPELLERRAIDQSNYLKTPKGKGQQEIMISNMLVTHEQLYEERRESRLTEYDFPLSVCSNEEHEDNDIWVDASDIDLTWWR